MKNINFYRKNYEIYLNFSLSASFFKNKSDYMYEPILYTRWNLLRVTEHDVTILCTPWVDYIMLHSIITASLIFTIFLAILNSLSYSQFCAKMVCFVMRGKKLRISHQNETREIISGMCYEIIIFRLKTSIFRFFIVKKMRI